MRSEIYIFSATDISDIRAKLNNLLNSVRLVALPRADIEIADPARGFGRLRNDKYKRIVKVINRWGIDDKEGRYYELLNSVIGRISSTFPLLQIYGPIQLLLLNKLFDQIKAAKSEFTQEEVDRFFLRPHHMLMCSHIGQSGVYLNDFLLKLNEISATLASENAKEFLHQGVGRRLSMLKQNVDSIDNLYSDSRMKNLTDNENVILCQNINLFYANIFAILDCIAFVFAFEILGICRDRKAYDKVGLFNKHFYPQIAGLSDWLELVKLEPWHKEIRDLRHPIAHRIPLYIPDILLEEESQMCAQFEKEHSAGLNEVLEKMKGRENSGRQKINEIAEQVNSLNEEFKRLAEARDNGKLNAVAFSGCFLHSHEESQKYYHLTRVIFDIGTLYFILDRSFEFLLHKSKKNV